MPVHCSSQNVGALECHHLPRQQVIGSPVRGFLPLRPCFSFPENLPDWLTSISSPFCRDCFISSKRVSIIWADSVLVKMFLAKSASTIRAFVGVIDCSSKMSVTILMIPMNLMCNWGMREDTALDLRRHGQSSQGWSECLPAVFLGDSKMSWRDGNGTPKGGEAKMSSTQGLSAIPQYVHISGSY